MKDREHRKTAYLALENARAIAADARYLMEDCRDARALSLAVVGCEEAGKGLLHTFAALGLAPNVVGAFERRGWSSPLLNHLFKQLAIEMIGGADAQLDDYEMAAAGELPPYPPPERTARIVCGCARTLEDMFGESGGAAAGKNWFAHMREMLSRFGRSLPYKTPDEERMKGLYVDLGRSSGQPMDVSHLDAAARISTLDYTLSVLAHLTASLQDDDLWRELGGEIEQVSEDYV